ncbi:MAG: hypothetical protein HY744_16190 [Deltaproteobacteria bacterium]|nr:hypothetical protein [Deltaproteobacteria bacterium]
MRRAEGHRSNERRVEDALAKRHLRDGTLALYDLTSTYFERRTCPLAKLGHNRDGKKDKLQIVFGLLCDGQGRPVAVDSSATRRRWLRRFRNYAGGLGSIVSFWSATGGC